MFTIAQAAFTAFTELQRLSFSVLPILSEWKKIVSGLELRVAKWANSGAGQLEKELMLETA